MAEPKKKLSKTRTHLRRSQYKISAVTPVICPNCSEPTRSHTVCPNCGYYDGKKVIGQAPTKRIVLDDQEATNK